MTKKIIFALLLSVMAFTVSAQEKVWQIDEVSVINMGDGRLLFRQTDNEQTPLNGEHRIIDGYHSEYILAEFKDGLYDGKYQHFKNGKLQEEATYRGGIKNGTYVSYFSDGKTPESQRNIVDGKVDGVSKTFFSNGQVETEKGYKLAVEDGVDRRYDMEGNLVLDRSYKDGKPDGKWTEHITSNVGDFTRISEYKDGKRIGLWSETWKDGSPRSKSAYKEGLKDGVWISYRKDGTPDRSTTYKADQKSGEETKYYTDGKPEKIETYLDGKLNGPTKEFYYESGKLKTEYNYKNGKREGTYKRFFDDGKLREEGRCESDREVYRKEYYANGKLKSVAERKSGSWETLEQYDASGKKQ